MAIAAALSGVVPACVHAAGLGRLTVQSALGQPLRAQVEITSLGREEVGSLSARLAPAEAFRQAGLEYNPALSGLRFAIERGPTGGTLIRITSSQAINEPFVDLLVELNWASGKFVREYTFLLDPPELGVGGQTVAGGRSTADSIVTPAAGAQSASAQRTNDAAVTAAPVKAPSAASAQSSQKARNSAARASAGSAPQQSQAAPAPASTHASDAVVVRSGDTLAGIAARVKPVDVALEQAVMAIYTANPKAFFGSVHQMLAGSTLQIPDRTKMAAVDEASARREIRAQAADFNAYRARLAAEARRVEPVHAGRSIAGSVGAKVDDKAAPAASGDQLKLSRSGPANASSADAASATGTAGARGTAGAESQIAREAALREQQERVVALERNVADLQQLIELKNRQLAELQRQVEAARSAGKTASGIVGDAGAAKTAAPASAAEAAAQVSAAVPAATSQAASAVDATSGKPATAAGQASAAVATNGVSAPETSAPKAAETSAPSSGGAASLPATTGAAVPGSAAVAATPAPTGADSPAASAADAASTPSAAPAAAASGESGGPPASTTDDTKPAAAAAPAAVAPTATSAKKPTQTPAPEPSVLEALMDNPLVLPAFAAIALGIGAYGLYAVRRRRKPDEFEDSLSAADAFTANSLFGSTGGQAVDTHNSLFATSARDSGVDVHSTEVDPIAEAEVYIAYGREAQAEEILREALKRQPERQAIRLKLLEIHAARKDAAAFALLAQEMYDLTAGHNEEWPKVVTLGLSIDPTNALYTGLGEGTAAAPVGAARPGEAAPQVPGARASSPAADLDEAAGAAAAMFGEKLHDVGVPSHPAAAVGPFAETVPMDGEREHGQEMPALDFDLDLDSTDKSEAAAAAEFSAAASGFEPPALEPTDLERAIDGRFELPSLDLDLGMDSNKQAQDASGAGESRGAQDDELPALADLGDFRIDLPSLEGIDTQPALLDEDDHERPAVDLADFDGADALGNLDLSSSQLGLAPADAAVAASDSSRWQEMATKLDLAAAYEEIGDKEGARELLQEVLEGGDIAQQQKARAMLSKIS